MLRPLSKFICAFLSAWLWAITAGNAAAPAPRYCVDVWGTEQGLPQSSVITMIQAKNGYLWLGTLNGLVRFDGIRFAVFDESNTPGLASSRIVKIFEDNQTNLWIGTESAGAALIKEGRVISLDIGRGRREGRLMSVCEDSVGAVWLYTADGELCRHLDGKVDVWKTGAEAFSRSRTLAAEPNGPVWMGSDAGLAEIDPTTVKTAAELPKKVLTGVGKVDFMLASKTGGHWRFSDGQIQKWRGGRLDCNLGSYPWPVGTVVTAACEDRDAHLIVGTLGQGVFWFDAAGKANQISKSEGLSNDSILSIHADNAGNLWVGTDGGGLNRVRPQLFHPLEPSLGLTVQSVSEDDQGGLWFSSKSGGVHYWKDGLLKQFSSRWGSLSRFNVMSILVDRKQQVWAGTFGVGAFRLKNGVFEHLSDPDTGSPEISAMHQDRAGRLWLGTQGGLACWDEKEWRLLTIKDGLSANIVRAIADDAEGNLWIGTERGGLNCLRNGRFTSFQQKNGFPSDNISALHVDGQGVLWVGTFGSGLVRVHAGKWTSYTTREGLISNGVDYLLEDSRGDLWIGSNRGLMCVTKKALNDFANGAISFVPCRSYEKRDGLPSSECSFGAQPAACRTQNGLLWFPTIAGLVSIDPSHIQPNTNVPPVVIESVLVDGREQNTNSLLSSLPGQLVLPAGTEQLEFRFTSLDLGKASGARFRFRLEGHETHWIDAGNGRLARYSKVPPGRYRFQVIACNEDGVWNQTGRSLALVVLPPFWRTWWFMGTSILGFLGAVVGVVHYVSTQRLQRQLEGLRQQQALEKERARIARDIHDQVGASLTQISLLGEMVESDKQFPDEIETHGQQISQTARETARALDEIVWTVNPSNDTLDGLITYLCKYAQEYLAVASLRYRLEVPPQLPGTSISPEVRHNVFLAAKESITNVVKHARASEVSIRLRLDEHRFELEIEDDGRGPAGFEKKTDRNGLRNMRKRMEDIGGEFSLRPGAKGGTLVRLTAPIRQSI